MEDIFNINEIIKIISFMLKISSKCVHEAGKRNMSSLQKNKAIASIRLKFIRYILYHDQA